MGESGDKGLSHLKVDRRAGAPDGTTSRYFRTRSALLRAVADRLAQRDYAILLSVVDQVRNGDSARARPSPSALATQLVTIASEPFRTQVKARYEFFMLSARDPDLAELFQQNIDLERELLHDFVVRLQQPTGSQLDETVIADQTLAVMALISGITLTLITGDPAFRSPEKIDRLLLAAVAGVKAVHEDGELAPGSSAAVTPDRQVSETPTWQQPTVMTADTRRGGPAQRRRDLCDAAIEILGETGLKGLSHLKVDRRVGVADGTTSVHFRTRAALLRATTERLAERARDGLVAATALPLFNGAGNGQRTASMMATQLVTAATEPFRTQVKARYELFMLATRDAEMAGLFQQNVDIELGFLRRIVLDLQPPDATGAEALLENQTHAMFALLSGIILTLVAGDPSFLDPAKVDRFARAVVTGMSAVAQQQAAVGNPAVANPGLALG